MTADEQAQRVLTVYSCAADWPDARVTYPIMPLPLPDGPVQLGCNVEGATLRYRYRTEGDWTDLGITPDQSAISHEAGNGPDNNFTGAFIGICAHDTSGRGRHADFTDLTYQPLNGGPQVSHV